MYNKIEYNISKSVESLRRKAKGPVKWQPVATFEMHCLSRQCFLFKCAYLSKVMMEEKYENIDRSGYAE